MTVEELIAISRDGLIDLGAHTVNHPDLATLPSERQRWEIEMSKATTGSMVGATSPLVRLPLRERQFRYEAISERGGI
jgi:peptidoglycan/xylan/chitin deacetylase (PgdA/CDA1 family)